MRQYSIKTIAWLAMAVGLWAAVEVTWAQEELFVEPGATVKAPVDQESYQKSTKRAYVKRHRLVTGIQKLAAEKDQQVTLNLFPDVTYKATISKFVAEGVANCWMGHVDGLPMSQVELYIDGNSIEGKVDTGDRLFSIKMLDEQVLIREADKKLLPRLDKDQRAKPAKN